MGDNEVKNSNEKYYLPGSLIISALIISGTMLIIGASVIDSINDLSDTISEIELGVAPSGGDNGDKPTPPAPDPDDGVDFEEMIQGQPFEGDENAPVTIIEFSDFECPFCANAYSGAVKEIREKYVETGKAKLVYMDYPLDQSCNRFMGRQLHPNACKASEAAECAADQGMFWEYHDKLFENQRNLTNGDLKQYAVDLGLDAGEFNSCLDSGDKASEVVSDIDFANAAGVTGTPTFFVNGTKIVGAQPFSAFEPVIEAELAE